jgi:argininosuccinate lyase
MNTKLWEKEKTQTPGWLEAFTAGADRQNDLVLAEYDVLASMAHAAMLARAGLITAQENAMLQEELKNILALAREGKLAIEEHVEDIHSQIELMLTRRLGEAGKKIHTGRSRNDQVLTAIKLYVKNAIKETAGEVRALFDLLQRLSEKHSQVLMPGYTHLQVAMPSSFGLWFGAYAESLSEDMDLLLAAYRAADRNPLGSGAGYGSSLPLDRTHTTLALNFTSMNYNAVYAQMTRGKTEKLAATALAGVASTLARMSMDICLFMSQNFNFLAFPDELTTGSSIMPHKKNPDVFELVRGKCNRIQALPGELTLLLSNLPSGYQRDLQLTKECLFPAFSTLNDCLKAATLMLEQVQVNKNILAEERYACLFSVEKVNRLVKEGVPFREAYQAVGREIEEGSFQFTGEIHHTHEGSIGNLMTGEIKREFYARLNTLLLS